MNPKDTNDLSTLYAAMEKYDFKKKITVTVSIMESDDDEKYPEEHIDNGDGVAKSLEPVNINGSEQITSVSFQNTQKKYTQNNNNNNDDQLNFNNDVILSDCNRIAGQQNNSEINVNSKTTDLVLSQGQIVNSHPTTVFNDSSSSYRENLSQELDILSKCIITILISYNYYNNCIMNCRENEIQKKKMYNEKYMHLKQRCFHTSYDIVTRTILPQGKNFCVTNFLHRTLHLAKHRDNFYCKYKDVESVYNEIISSNYKKVCSAEAMQNYSLPANIQNHRQYHPLQTDVQNGKHYRNTTETINNSTTLQQNSHNCWRFSNSAHTLNNEINTASQENLRNCRDYNYEAQAASNGPDLIYPQNSQNYRHPNNISHAMKNGHNSAPRGNLQNVGNYNNRVQTINKGPNLLIQQNSKIERHSNIIQQPMSNEESSPLQSLLKYDIYYNNGIYTRNAGQNSALQPNQKNIGKPNSTINKVPSSIFQQNLENDRNYHNKVNTVEQVPSTCVFQYKCPDYEVRLDVNNHILNNINKSNHTNNLPTSDTSTIVEQYASDNVRKTIESTVPNNHITQIPHKDASQTLQEPMRSISRDSGLMSPGNNLMNDLSTLGEDPVSPCINLVTSLNPGATQFPIQGCYVCGENTNKKCLGCYKYYYCSMKCQSQHWSSHLFDCTNNPSEIHS